MFLENIKKYGIKKISFINQILARKTDNLSEKDTPDKFLPNKVSYYKPIELTSQKNKLPHNLHRIDVVKDVLKTDEVWKMGITGKDITVAVIDTGIYPHPDVKNRLIEFIDFVNNKNGVENAYDDNGHGTHCAGLVGGDGTKANGNYKGPAYEANLIGIKVLDKMGSGSLSNIVKSIYWCIENKDKYNIKVLSMSLGADSVIKEKDDILAKAVEDATKAGLIVVIAAGNSGPLSETVGTPGISQYAITVGAYDDKNTISTDDDTPAFFTSKGPTPVDKAKKPDISSPGVEVVSLRSPNSTIDKSPVIHYGDYYTLLSGTSMATPIVAGVVALILQANPNLSPQQVKQIIMETATPVKGASHHSVGAGLINPVEAVKKAKEMKAIDS
ncbi:MAG: S8 family peptidase [Candidatus Calescibacterium sp.]|nr:S8 family peptidase [Candidatus Calescibacterium sp.]